MWIPLVVLALLATIGGFVGISPAFTGGKHGGGKLNIVNWLNPIIWSPATHEFGGEAESGSQTAATRSGPNARVSSGLTPHEAASDSAYVPSSFNLPHAIESKLGSETATEWLFIILSLLVAVIGIGLGLLFYVKDTSLPDLWA